MPRDFCPENGNWFYLWNDIAEALSKIDLSNAEFRIVFCVMRFTWGFRKSIKPLRWTKILNFTELKDSTAWKAMKKLKLRGIIKTFPQEGKTGQLYKINSKIDTWKLLPPGRNLPPGRKSPSRGKVTPLKDNIKDKGVWGEISPTGKYLKKDNPWLDESAWNDFVLHRENIKHELTPLAITKTLNLLQKYAAFQAIIIDATIVNNWRGLFPPKGGTSKKAAKSLHERKLEKWKRRYNERYKNE